LDIALPLVAELLTGHDAATQAGFRWDSKEANEAVSEATKDSNQAINSLIGSEANEKLEALKGTSFHGSLNGVDEFALDMEDAGVALSADQSQALAQWLHDLANSAKNPDASTPGYKDVDIPLGKAPLTNSSLPRRQQYSRRLSYRS
jgi:hypothetical protein